MEDEDILEVLGVRVKYRTGIPHYSPRNNVIYINQCNDLERVVRFVSRRPSAKKFSFYHELGHAIDENLNLCNTSEYKKVFGDATYVEYRGSAALIESVIDSYLGSASSDDEDYVGPYAKTHPIEDFADSFAFYMCGIFPEGSKKLDKKYRYIISVLDHLEQMWLQQ